MNKLISAKNLDQTLTKIKSKIDSSKLPSPLPIANGGTGNTTGYITTGKKDGTTVGERATAEGISNVASGHFSHAEGLRTISKGNNSHAEGNGAKAIGESSHAEGIGTIANEEASHTEGRETKASGKYSHAEGWDTTAAGITSHTEGNQTIASGGGAHAEGEGTKAIGQASHAGGYETVANNKCQTVIGIWNIDNTIGTDSYTVNPNSMFVIGNGTDGNTRSNCFRVGYNNVWGGTYKSSGADYAEMFEWEDGNPNDEDRVGRFVTFSGKHIRYATSEDIILGITSGNPSICGDTYDDQWQGMYMVDVFGRPIYEDVTIPAEMDDNGEILIPEHTERRQKLNPNYKPDEEYVGRSSRKEWTPVGIIGKLVMMQDGTITHPGQFVKPGDSGVATKSDISTNCVVMNVIDSDHALVFIVPSFK